jgi:hemerythrin-like domain-containing protein
MTIIATGNRRNFLIQGATLMGAAALGGAAAITGCASQPAQAEVTATEDLMREHGALQRLLLIYEELARRLKCCQDSPAPLLPDVTSLIRRYIQEHHEKLEEEHIFPRFERAGKMVALAKILRGQHEAGRKLLDHIRTQAAGGGAKNFVLRAQLEACLLLFSRMYRPHAAREDTLLFPALRAVMSPVEFADLGKRFTDQETAHLGPDHYDKIILEIGDLEKTLDIHDLEQFTPRF